MTGRPLRFMAMMLAGWTLGRLAVLWPTIDSVPALIDALAPPAAATAFSAEAPARDRARRALVIAPALVVNAASKPAAAPPALPGSAVPASTPAPSGTPAEPPRQPPPLRLPALAAATGSDRFGMSLWAMARSGRADPRPGSQLGGSQAGLRATYALDAGRRLAVSVRLSAPLRGGDPEAAIGLDWQPGAAPIHILAEQRLATGRGRGGPAVLVVGGVDPQSLPGGLTIEAYGQAGAVLRDRADLFADGAARLTRTVARPAGLRIDLGLGAWGGAQRGAARLDVGPTVAVALPLGGRAVRLALDWRQRIAGSARPGSGPAFSLGTDL